MDQEKKWMLMTYYCPTHGDSGLVKPIQLTKKEISKKFLTYQFQKALHSSSILK